MIMTLVEAVFAALKSLFKLYKVKGFVIDRCYGDVSHLAVALLDDLKEHTAVHGKGWGVYLSAKMFPFLLSFQCFVKIRYTYQQMHKTV